MEQLVLWSTVLIGPCYALMIWAWSSLDAISNTQILFDLNEWGTLFAAAIVAMAVAGVVVQLI